MSLLLTIYRTHQNNEGDSNTAQSCNYLEVGLCEHLCLATCILLRKAVQSFKLSNNKIHHAMFIQNKSAVTGEEFQFKKSASYDFVSINTTGPCEMKNKICSCFDPTQPVAHISIISTSDNFNFNKSPTSHNIIGSVFIHKQNLLNNLGENQQFWRHAIYWFMENSLPSKIQRFYLLVKNT